MGRTRLVITEQILKNREILHDFATPYLSGSELAA